MASNWPLTDLLDRLSEATLIHVDARVLALYMLGDEVLGPQVETIMRVAGSGVLNVQTSALTLYQILAEVYRRGRADLAGEVARMLQVHPGLTLVPATTDVAIQAAEVRAQLGGRPERAIQIATALVEGADVYVTTGSGLRRIGGMSVVNLDDLPTPT